MSDKRKLPTPSELLGAWNDGPHPSGRPYVYSNRCDLCRQLGRFEDTKHCEECEEKLQPLLERLAVAERVCRATEAHASAWAIWSSQSLAAPETVKASAYALVQRAAHDLNAALAEWREKYGDE